MTKLRFGEMQGCAAGIAAFAAGLTLLAAQPAAAADPPANCAAWPNIPPDKIYPLPNVARSECDVTGMAIAVHDGHFRSLYGSQIYSSDDVPQIMDILHGVDKRLRDAALAALAPTCQPKPDAPCATLKILLFAHGGLVDQDSALGEAQKIAPGVLNDHYQPIFLIWNSGLLETYGERLCCVMNGEQSKEGLPYFLPSRLFADIVGGVGRLPELWGEQVLRFNDSVLRQSGTQYYLSNDDPGQLCQLFWSAGCQHINYPQLGAYKALNSLDEAPKEDSLAYRALFEVRLGTTAFSQIGAKDWDDMVRRTHLAVQPPMVNISGRTEDFALRTSPGNPDPCDALTTNELQSVTTRRDAGKLNSGNPQPDRFDVQSEGGFAIFLDHFACETKRGYGVPNPSTLKVELYYYGHSMGAIVGDEVISAHPELPWKRIVYMAAADSLREFRAYVSPALACAGDRDRTRCLGGDVKFYGLMLHPLAESHDLEYAGTLPEGSLLEWIDEMFGGPTSIDERRFGKWTNVEKGLGFFPTDARARMYFRVFPAQATLLDRPGQEGDLYARQCAALGGGPKPPRCHPIVHGDFTNYAFWRDAFLCDSAGDAAACEGSAPPRGP